MSTESVLSECKMSSERVGHTGVIILHKNSHRIRD